ncbi:MAG TPA: bifunctional DNA primase/polymerase [Actinomycetota bacterium]
MTGRDDPARLSAGDLLAALGELTPSRAAEAYAALGYPVVPLHAVRPDGGCTCHHGTRCTDPGKHPCLKAWPSAASTAPAEVRRWWQRWPQANVGLATGTRFDVLDLDGPEGMEALRAALSQRHPTEHPGPVARTGGGGWHLLYAPTGLGNRVGLLPGVDWRGRGGVIVTPPSQHRSGARYTWARALSGELPAVPDGLRRLLAPARPAVRPPGEVPAGRAAAWAQGALEHEAHAVATAREHTCNATLNRAAFRLGQLVAAGLLDAGEVRARLLAAALAAPATGHHDRERKARATIESGLAGGAHKPRAGLPARTGVGG